MATLKQKTARGLLWGLFNQGAMQALNLVFGVVLGRLLTPEDYGIVGVLAVFTLVAQELQTAGFTQGLVNMRQPTERDYNAVFWFNITLSACIYCALFAAAPLIAEFFHEPRLVGVSRFVFLAFFIGSFGISAGAYMTKNIMQKEAAVIGVVSLLCSGTVGVTLALLDFSYWSLAWQQVVYITVYNIGRYRVVPFRPSLIFSIEPIRGMWRFSLNMMLTNILNSLSMKILTVIFGRLLPMAQVGNFSQADKWNITASDTIRCAVNNVAQPVLAEVRDNRERTLRVLRQMMRFASFIAFPAMFCLTLVSREFILITIGSRWLESAELLGLLAIGGSVLPHYALLKNIVISHGRSRLYMCLCAAQILLQTVLVVALAKFGIYYVVLAFAAYSLLFLFVWYACTLSITRYPFTQLLADILPFAAAAAGAAVASAYIVSGQWIDGYPGLCLLLLARTLTAALLYLAVMKAFRVQMLEDAVNWIRHRNT